MTTDTCRGPESKGQPERSTKTLLDKWTFLNRIIGDPELQPTAKIVATYLMWRMNCRYETCFPARDTISADTHLSIRTVHDAVKALKDAGWLTWQRRRDQSSIYRFCWERAGADRESYVANDRAPRQEPETANPATSETATNSTLTTGKDLTRERSSRLSTASPTRDGERRGDLTSAEQEPSKGRTPAAAPLQENSPEWWKDRVWNKTGEDFRARFYPTTSKAAFKKRLGEVLKRQNWEIPPVDRAMRAALDAEPAMDAWDYVTGILRRRAESGPDYSKPAVMRGVM